MRKTDGVFAQGRQQLCVRPTALLRKAKDNFAYGQRQFRVRLTRQSNKLKYRKSCGKVILCLPQLFVLPIVSFALPIPIGFWLADFFLPGVYLCFKKYHIFPVSLSLYKQKLSFTDFSNIENKCILFGEKHGFGMLFLEKCIPKGLRNGKSMHFFFAGKGAPPGGVK